MNSNESNAAAVILVYISRILEINKVLEKLDYTGKTPTIIDNKYMIPMFVDIINFVITNDSFIKLKETKVDESDKIRLMSIFTKDTGKAVLAFDTVYRMIKIYKKVLYKIKDGYNKAAKHMTFAGFTSTLEPKLDVLFFLIFFNDFPIALRERLFKTIKLRNAPLTDIIQKCNTNIVDAYKKVCSTTYDTIPPREEDKDSALHYLVNHKYVNLATEPGFVSLLHIITRLREFKDNGV